MDCYRVYQLIGYLKKASEFFDEYEVEEKYADVVERNLKGPFNGVLEDFGKYEEFIEKSLDMDKIEYGEFIINAKFSEELKEISGLIEEHMEKVEELKEEVVLDLDIRDVKLVESPTY